MVEEEIKKLEKEKKDRERLVRAARAVIDTVEKKAN